MGDHKSAKSPLLYIQQPNIKTPRASMQSHYRTPKKAFDDNKKGYPMSKKRQVNWSNFGKQDNDDEAEEEVTESSEEDSDQQESSHDRKKFKDMTLEERVYYFLDAPKHAPVMRCEVKTEGRNYRGMIIDYQEKNVYMRVGKRTTPTAIPFDTITEIRLLGF
ncbi:CotO family spore coat protein [Lentibacillus salicampi]|uniref:Spore coat protein CotO n=1 Tax=Lentibacillus salicampi TaxID=175306 RepID=A0A4Y9AGW6_9BACI|nr:CotO family spore coat protein [Lentibacillus salicampi]TFJ93624.1 hypothetical protein E4U82_06605 [Lentibacillus salicampi]